MASRTSASHRLRHAASRRTNQFRLRKLVLESLEQRQLLAVVTGGTGPGGFERTDGSSELEIWLDSRDINANGTAVSDGAVVSNWQDKSGNDRDFDGIVGDPNYVASSTNGYPTVNFDGNDVLNLKASENPRSFIDGNGAYTLISVARYSGTDRERIIAARTGHNWLFGYHGGGTGRFHYDNWGSLDVGGYVSDENWHLHMNLMNVFNDPNDPAGDFYRDGVLLSDNSRGTADSFNNNVPDGLTIGGWNSGNNEVSQSEVSELLMYNRVLNEAEHRILQNYLNAKYDVTPTIDLYAGDTGANGNYDRDVFGIGRFDASNQLLTAGQSGFGIEVTSLDDGDYVLAGHKVGVNGKSPIAGIAQITDRWNRAWYVDVSDANDNVSATLAFDYSDAGLTRTNEQTFKLLYASSDGGTFTEVAGAVATVNGDTVTFSVNAANLQDGYFTLGDSSLAPQVTTSPGDTIYQVNAPAVVIDAGVTLFDLDSLNLIGATVTVGGYVGGNTDVLGFTDQNGITGVYANGVLTLTGTTTLANYQTALRSVTYANANFVTPRTITFTVNDGTFTGSAGKRVVLVGTASADNILWEGDVDTNWNTPGNWSANRVPDGNDNAIFADAAVGTTVFTTASPLVGSVLLQNNSKSFTFTGDSIFTSTLTQSGTGTNIVSGTIRPDLTFTGTVSAGRLELRNSANSTTLPSGVWIVSGGTLAAMVNTTVTGLGGANVELAGGTLEFLPGPVGVVGGLQELWYEGNFDDNSIDPIDSGNGFLTKVPGATSILNTALAFDGGAMNARSGGLVGTDSIGAAWTGTLNVGPGLPLVAGDISFATTSDDGTVFWIDLDQNNVFSHAGANGDEMVVNNKGFHGNVTQFGSRNLAAGSYKIAMGFYEGGGGEFAEARFAQGITTNYGAMTTINPASPTQAGLWTIQSTPPGTLANNVSVTANSSIVLGSTVPAVALNKLTMAAGTTLQVTSSDTKQDLEFASVSLGGNATIAGIGAPDITLRNISETIASNLTFNANATIYLPTANTYTGVTTVNNNATVVVSSSGAFGATSNGTVVNSGGAVALSGNFAYGTAETLTLNGTGNASKDAALTVEGGTVSYAGAIVAASAAKIRTLGNNFILFGQLNVNGQSLEIRADRQIEVQVGGITGGGTITKTGGDRVAMFQNADGGTNFDATLLVNEGIWDARGNNSLGSTAGPTTVNNGARLELRDGRTLADNITINGNSGNAGAIRNENNNNTLTGNITLASDAMIFVNPGQLTITGQVNGGRLLTKTGPGVLVLKQDSVLSNFDLAGGEVRISTVNGLGSASVVSVDGGEALAFDASLTFNGSSALQSLVVNGGTLRAISGTTTLDIPIGVGVISDINFDGAGNLNIVRGFGNGNTPISSNFLNHYGFTRYPDGNDGQNLMNLDGNAATSMMSGGNPATHPNLTGQSLLTSGPGGRGLDFNDDNDYIAAVKVPGDNYTNLWVGRLHVSAANAGDWRFRLAELDDWGGMWLDIDKDGVFESNVAGLGSNRGEQLAWNDGGTKTVNLPEGDYAMAFTHLEGGGGSSIRFFFQSPTMAAEATITPSDPAQAGLWSGLSPVTPTTNVIKSGTGVVTLLGNNTFSGAVRVQQGTLVGAHNQAFGLDGGDIALSSGATFALQGNVTIDGENITGGDGKAAGQLGTIVNLSGNNTFLGNIAASTSPSAGQELSIASAAGTLTVGAAAGGHSLDAKVSKLAFDGDGAIVVNSVISNQTTTLFGNGLRHYGFRRDPGDALFDLNNNGGMLNGGSPTTHPTFTGQSILSDGPGARGLDFNLESEFITAVNVPNDNYANLFVGLLRVTAATAGNWEFRESDRDDWSGIWVDIDGDLVFESTQAGLGSNRGEQLAYNDQGTKTVFLTEGDHLIAFTHLEGGGDSRIEMRVKSPTMAGQAVVKPTDPVQSGYFQIAFAPQNELIKRGLGSVTLAGNNTYSGVTNVNAGMLVARHSNALGAAGQGTNVLNGATLGLSGGVTLAGDGLIINGNGALIDTDANGSRDATIGVIVSLDGANAVASTMTAQEVSLGEVGIGALAGATLNVNTNLDLRFSQLNVNGVGNTNINGVVSGIGTTVTFTQDLLPATGFATGDNQLYHFGFHVNNDAATLNLHNNGGAYNLGNPTTFTAFEGAGLLTDGPGSRGLDFNGDGDFRSVLASLQDDASGDGKVIDQDDQYSDLFTGYLNVSAANAGNWNFRINDHDDPAGIWIDLNQDGIFQAGTTGALADANGELVAWNGGCCAQRDLKTINLAEGSYRVAFTHREGGGGSTLDITFANPNLTERTIRPTDPAQSGLWSTRVFRQNFADNSLVKSGPGTLTLTAANTYNAGTTINGGRILANNTLGSATGPGAVTVNNAGTLGGTGIVSGQVTAQSGGLLSPGNGLADLAISNGLTLASGSTYVVEITGPTANTQYDQAIVAGAVNVSGAILNVVLTGTSSFPTNGQAFTIIDNDGTDLVGGTFVSPTLANLPQGATLVTSTGVFTISYTGGSGNDVVLTAQVPTVQFASAAFQASEAAGTTTVIQLTRTGALDAQSQVVVSLTGGTATGGTALPTADYLNTNFPQTVTFAPGASTATVSLTIFDDVVSDLGETIALSVAPVANVGVSGQTTTTFTIIDNDNRAPVAVNDPAGSVTVTEDAPRNITGVVGTVGSGVLGNDSDPDSDPLTITSINTSGITKGILTLSSGVLTYNPSGAFESLGVGATDTTQSFSYTISDGKGGTATATAIITVTGVNDAPTMGVPAQSAIVALEGTTISNTGSFSDIDLGDDVTFTARVNGVDTGTITKTGTNNGSWSWSLFVADDTSTPIQVVVTATDRQGATAQRTFTYDVDNVAPTLTISSATNPIAEGSTFILNLASFDPGADIISGWSINWGDGTSTPVTGNPGSVTHVYADGPDSFTITATATDEDGTYAATPLSVGVNNAAPEPQEDSILINNQPATPSGGKVTIVPGMSVTFIVSTTDPAANTVGSAEDQPFDFLIDFGDGTTATGTTTLEGDPLSFTHTYTTFGSFQPTLVVTDKDDGFNSPALDLTQVDAVRQVVIDGNLYMAGNNGADRIVVQAGGLGGVAVRLNNVLLPAQSVRGRVIVYGGNGSDTITVASNMPARVEFYGGAGDDYLAGGTNADILDGGPGRDRLLGGGGNDVLYGGPGNDTLSGGVGNDWLYGDSFLDEFNEAQLPAPNLQGADNLSGDAGDDNAFGEGGNDRVNGGLGNDLLRGGEGSDVVGGDAGDDILVGDASNDRLMGSAGNDVIIGGAHADTIYGGTGDDLIYGNLLGLASPEQLREILDLWIFGDQQGAVDKLKDDSAPETDNVADLLYGEGGNDWYLLYFRDKVSGTNEKAPDNTIETLT